MTASKTKTLLALAVGAALLFGSSGIASQAQGGSDTRATNTAAATAGKAPTKIRPISPALARSNARQAAETFYANRGPYIGEQGPEGETLWNERGVSECQRLGRGARVRCLAWVGLAAEISDEEVPYKTCNWWVETVRLPSGAVAVRDLVAKRQCETIWF